jgi:acetoin utilization deacetylase AcuC-like enzyme
MERLMCGSYAADISIHDDFPPFDNLEFLIAHEAAYIDSFFAGELTNNAGIEWSAEFAESVRYTNSSLYHAIKFATENENSLVLSPTSGFHHAGPKAGWGFCTFSGQVIGSVKRWRETGAVGAYLDLDGHYGNSIGDSVGFCTNVNQAITWNFNPDDIGEAYVAVVRDAMIKLETMIEAKTVDYLVWCHGADSHEDDDLGHNVNTEQWLECSEIFFSLVKRKRDEGFNVPVVMALFGGYRADPPGAYENYKIVVDLHVQDIEIGMRILQG